MSTINKQTVSIRIEKLGGSYMKRYGFIDEFKRAIVCSGENKIPFIWLPN